MLYIYCIIATENREKSSGMIKLAQKLAASMSQMSNNVKIYLNES